MHIPKVKGTRGLTVVLRELDAIVARFCSDNFVAVRRNATLRRSSG